MMRLVRVSSLPYLQLLRIAIPRSNVSGYKKLLLIRNKISHYSTETIDTNFTNSKDIDSIHSSVEEFSKSSQLLEYKNYYQNLQQTLRDLPEDVCNQSSALVTLHSRLNLPKEFSTSLLSRCLTCRSSNIPSILPSTDTKLNKTYYSKQQRDNYGLNIFGKNLLTFETVKYLLQKYPRLPTPVLNVAINAYISDEVLASIVKSWGVETENLSIMERFLRNEPVNVTLGKLRYFNNLKKVSDGIESISKLNFSETAAYALVIRSIIATLWTFDPKLSTKFINGHILHGRKLDITRLFEFEQPTRELARLCEREKLERPVSRLLAESGRLSRSPVFIVGVFSGEEKLGEGFGASLKEAKAKAASDALMKWYCYQPTNDPSQSVVVDPGTIIV